MQLTDQFIRLPLDQIVVDREARQRRRIFNDKGEFIQPDSLVESVRTQGVLSPILITSGYQLVFGERRLTASKLAGLPDIPVRFVEDLSPAEFQLLELVENLTRHELAWRDETMAVARLHELKKASTPGWTRDHTIKLTGNSQVPEILRVARDINNPRIADATSVKSAYNVLSRLDDRATADALGDIMDGAASLFDTPSQPQGPETAPTDGTTGPNPPGEMARPFAQSNGAVPTPPAPFPAPVTPAMAPPESIQCLDFLDWSASYSGVPFNFIHCDFPYGVNAFAGAMSGRDKWGTEERPDSPYSDDPAVYERLIEGLCKNLDRVMAYSGHLMFWLSADIIIQNRTLEMFRMWAPSLVFQTFPLIWHKTDNVGILPDPRRGPRRVFETCLVASREDRLILKSVSNAYGAPTNKEHHPSTKPEPVLRHFMSMFVDENTRMLDPTCGSGSSLRAAESLGAKAVLGLELDPEHCKNAQHALKQFRLLRKVAK